MTPLRDDTTRRAKIVCTIGPASNSEEMIRELMLAGMDVARLNFSHGAHEEHAQVIARLRKVAAELDRSICILQDLQGPKIRTGRLKDHLPITLETGQLVTITSADVVGSPEVISTTYHELANDVKPGEHILLSDGRIELVITQIVDGNVVCRVLNGGALGEHQGINLPGTNVSIPSLTEKDEADLDFGLKQGVDVIAISFVRTADDVMRARRAIAARGCAVPLIAKLEKPQAVDNLDAILEITDGVMVARGDLGVEVAPEKVPLIQKHIIRRALDFRRPVITATQMLESMIQNPRPTRAEASDVANAIFDGTDAVMLSGETAVGQVSARGREYDVPHCGRGGKRPRPEAGSHPSAGRAPVDCRDHLRGHGPCCARPGSARHCGLHGQRRQRTHALQISSGAPHLCLYSARGGVQPYEFTVGRHAGPLPGGPYGAAYGRICRGGVDAAGGGARRRGVRAHRRHQSKRGCDELPEADDCRWLTT